jgi:hypothetical protein
MSARDVQPDTIAAPAAPTAVRIVNPLSRYRRQARLVHLGTSAFVAVEVTRQGRVIPLLDTLRRTRREAMRAALASAFRNVNEHADLWCTVMRVRVTGEVLAR